MTIIKIDKRDTSEFRLDAQYTGGIKIEEMPQRVYEEQIGYQRHCLERLEETLEKFRGVDTDSKKLVLSRYMDCRNAGVKEEATKLLRKYDRLPALPEPQRALLAA